MNWNDQGLTGRPFVLPERDNTVVNQVEQHEQDFACSSWETVSKVFPIISL